MILIDVICPRADAAEYEIAVSVRLHFDELPVVDPRQSAARFDLGTGQRTELQRYALNRLVVGGSFTIPDGTNIFWNGTVLREYWRTVLEDVAADLGRRYLAEVSVR